jgi:hypothetical protein
MEIITKLYILLFFSYGFGQNYLVPIKLSEDIANTYYLNSVYLNPDNTKSIGKSKSGVITRNINFKDGNHRVISNYLLNSFSIRHSDKKALVVSIDYISVEIDEISEINLTLSFYEKENNQFFHLLTVGSHIHKSKHFEVVLSQSFQECFDGFVKYLQYSKPQITNKLDDLSIEWVFPIEERLEKMNLEKGCYSTLSDFQFDNLREIENMEVISLRDGLSGYLIKIDGEKEITARAICDGKHLYYRINKRYFRIIIEDSNMKVLAHDQRKVFDSRLLSIYCGLGGGMTALAVRQPAWFFPGLVVGSFAGHAFTSVQLNRRMKKEVIYEFNIRNGEVSPTKD